MSPSPLRSVPSAWRFALLGAVASLPVTVVLNRLPAAEAGVAGGIVVVGAFVAGAVAAARSSDPGAAGLRAGLLGGVVGVLALVATAAGPGIAPGVAAWPSPSRTVALVALSLVALCLAPAFGLLCGRVGGWLTDAVTARRAVDPS